MSTYAVFGMTPLKAKADARKRVKTYDKNGASITPLSEDEWALRVDLEATKTMKSTRIVQLSDAYDMPGPAEQFLELAKREGGVRLEIRARERTTSTRTGKPTLHWVAVE